MTTESFSCSKHFEESDFVYHTNDTKNRRKQKLQKEKLKCRYLKNGSYPTKFLNCPPSLGFSDAKVKISSSKIRNKRLSKLGTKTVWSIN